MMADLIDRAALGIGKANPKVFENAEYAKGWNSAIEILQAAPTVDAVEVVRCKDCKYYGDEYFCPLRSLADYTDTNDYCSMGERREGNG